MPHALSCLEFVESRIEIEQYNTTVDQLQMQLWTCKEDVASATHLRQQEEALQRNKAPKVSAGSDRVVFEGDDVELIATATDPEGDALTIQWELVGPTTLSGVPSQASTSDSFNKVSRSLRHSACETKAQHRYRSRNNLFVHFSLAELQAPSFARRAKVWKDLLLASPID